MVLTQANLHFKFPGGMGLRALFCEDSTLPAVRCLSIAGLCSFPSGPASLSGQTRLVATLGGGWDYELIPLSGNGQTSLQRPQGSSFEDSNQDNIYPAEFPDQVAPLT